MTFDIIIVTYNRESLLKNCIESILSNEPSELRSIIIVNNGGREVSNHFEMDNLIIEQISIPKVSPGEARNVGISHSKADYLLFLDDDTCVPTSYFPTALSHLCDKSVDVLGGPDKTFTNATFFQRSLGIALSSPLSTGPTMLRHCRSEKRVIEGSEINLILCHLWFKSSLFKTESFLFNKQYFRNEENVLLEQLRLAKKNMVYDSELSVFHYRKDNAFEIFRVTFLSAFFRKKSFIRGDSRVDPLFFVPSTVIILLLFLIILSPETFAIFSLCYVAVSAAIYLVSRQGSLSEKLLAIAIQLEINIAYALGFLIPLKFEDIILNRK